jgi:hypothetical protein
VTVFAVLAALRGVVVVVVEVVVIVVVAVVVAVAVAVAVAVVISVVVVAVVVVVVVVVVGRGVSFLVVRVVLVVWDSGHGRDACSLGWCERMKRGG